MILALIAIVLGFLIYRQLPPEKRITVLARRLLPSPKPTPPPPLTDEQAVLHPPGENGSDADRQKFSDLIHKLAKDAVALVITNCQPQPLVMHLVQDTTLEIKNADDLDHYIVLDPQHKYTIPAKKSSQVKVTFSQGPGIYGYACDQSPQAVGFFSVTPPTP